LDHHCRTFSRTEVSQGGIYFSGAAELWSVSLKRNHLAADRQYRDKDRPLQRFRLNRQCRDTAIQPSLPGIFASAGVGGKTAQVAQAQGQQTPGPKLGREGRDESK